MRFLILLVLFCFSTSLYAQPSSTGIKAIDGLDSAALYAIMTLTGVDFHKYTISSKFKSYFCDLKVYEYKRGSLVDSFSARKDVGKYDFVLSVGNNLEKNGFQLGIYSQELGDSALKLYSTIGGLGYRKKLKLEAARAYSWKEVYDVTSKKHPLKPLTYYPLLAYTTAVGKEHSSHLDADEFCKINGEVVPFEQWYSKLGIEHYFVVGIKLEK